MRHLGLAGKLNFYLDFAGDWGSVDQKFVFDKHAVHNEQSTDYEASDHES